MEGLLSWFLFALLLFLMWRFGCTLGLTSGGHGHGGHGHGRKASAEDTDHVDPVCGMSVDPSTGYGKMHDGRLYRFCSKVCLDKFEAKPSEYATPKQLEVKS